jgi:hypothetical protein
MMASLKKSYCFIAAVALSLCFAPITAVSAAEELLFGVITPTCKNKLLAVVTDGAAFDQVGFVTRVSVNHYVLRICY